MYISRNGVLMRGWMGGCVELRILMKFFFLRKKLGTFGFGKSGKSSESQTFDCWVHMSHRNSGTEGNISGIFRDGHRMEIVKTCGKRWDLSKFADVREAGVSEIADSCQWLSTPFGVMIGNPKWLIFSKGVAQPPAWTVTSECGMLWLTEIKTHTVFVDDYFVYFVISRSWWWNISTKVASARSKSIHRFITSKAPDKSQFKHV